MSNAIDETINCKGCGWQQSFTIWASLNATLNPEQKQGLIDGSLTRFVCEKCGWSSEVVYSLLFHDMEKQVMTWLIPGEGEPDAGEIMAGPMPAYRLRVVRTRNELLEKILIFDNGFDDRPLEYFKLLIRAQSEQEGAPLKGPLFFGGVTELEEVGVALRFEHLTDEGAQALELPQELYHRICESLADKLPSVESEGGEWLVVDATYASGFLGE